MRKNRAKTGQTNQIKGAELLGSDSRESKPVVGPLCTRIQACGTSLGGSGKQEPHMDGVLLLLSSADTQERQQIKRWGADGSSKCCMGGEGEEGNLRPQNSILHAGKDSSCITTVLLLAKTMIFSSCCFSCVCWYHSRVTSVSCVGIRVTWGNNRYGPCVKRLWTALEFWPPPILKKRRPARHLPGDSLPTGLFPPTRHPGQHDWVPHYWGHSH